MWPRFGVPVSDSDLMSKQTSTGLDVDHDEGLSAAIRIGGRHLLGPGQARRQRHRRLLRARDAAGREQSDGGEQHDKPHQAFSHRGHSLPASGSHSPGTDGTFASPEADLSTRNHGMP